MKQSQETKDRAYVKRYINKCRKDKDYDVDGLVYMRMTSNQRNLLADFVWETVDKAGEKA